MLSNSHPYSLPKLRFERGIKASVTDLVVLSILAAPTSLIKHLCIHLENSLSIFCEVHGTQFPPNLCIFSASACFFFFSLMSLSFSFSKYSPSCPVFSLIGSVLPYLFVDRLLLSLIHPDVVLLVAVQNSVWSLDLFSCLENLGNLVLLLHIRASVYRLYDALHNLYSFCTYLPYIFPIIAIL